MRNFVICSGPQIWVGEYHQAPIVVAARTKVWVWGFSLAGIAGSNPLWSMMSLL